MRAHRRLIVRIAVLGALSAGMLSAGAVSAGAQGEGESFDRSDQIVLNGELVVTDGQTVGSAAILNGPATIDGTVRESLFVLNGRADISGSVGRDVVVVNGKVVIHSGAHIGGDVVTQSPPQIEKGATIDGRLRSVATRFDVGGLGVASRFVWWVGYSASTLFLGLLLLLLFPGFDAAATRTWRARAGASVGLGAAVFFLFPVVAVIFLVTIVGIPLGLFMLLGLALVYTVGYVAGAQVLGRLLIRPPTSRFLAFLVGWGILRLIALVPFLGGFAFLVVALVGLGVLVLAGRRPAEMEVSTAPPPPPPPPVPAPV